MSDTLILTLNSGSSSIKTSLYRMGDREKLLFSGQLEGITREHGRFRMRDGQGAQLVDRNFVLPDHAVALQTLFDWLRTQPAAEGVAAVGHRVVHGGPRFRHPQRVSPDMLAEVRRLVPFDPLHLPSEIEAVEAVARLYPAIPQVACFDTAFHADIPDVARLLPLPRRLADQGVHRYGFHGLSYEYVLEELSRLDPAAAKGRLVIAHLGSGASMSAISNGKCVDTSMGFTPTGGLVMATRCGDLDPGVLLYLLAEQKLPVQELNQLVNHESGLLGVSGRSADMRELLDLEANDPAAKQAIDVFCWQARKFIGAYAAILGGLDTLIFTAGVGENSPPIRKRICTGLEFLGLDVDGAKNDAQAGIVSTSDSRVTVRMMRTNEELMIARHVSRVLAGT